MAGEFDIISRYFKPLAGPEGLLLEDDAACIPARPGFDTIVTKDLLVAGTHFFPGDSASDIAFKALSVNVSDLVSKGAKPAFYFLGLSIGKEASPEWFALFSEGLQEAQSKYGIYLIGGDTTKTDGPVTVSITAIGFCPAGSMVKRSGAKPGDSIYVTGPLGRSTVALKLIHQQNSEIPDGLMKAYLRPVARLDCLNLVHDYANASADISDGVFADLGHICKASGTGAVLNLQSIPVSNEVLNASERLSMKLTEVFSGGDDYEIVFTASSEKEKTLLNKAARAGITLYKIGEITKGTSIEVVDPKGNLVQVDNNGYQHFSSSEA